MKRLAVWSGPRNISTAMMRSWENRPDTVVVDEPLYAYYLDQTGLEHPGRDEVIAAGDRSWTVVVAKLTESEPLTADGVTAGVYFQKHMAHHLLPAPATDWVSRLHNVLLIRDPREVVASYVRSRSEVTAADIGLIQQVALYDQLTGADQPPPVIDAGDFLRRPEGYLRWLCNDLGVDFSAAMVSWPAGPRASDGVWAPYWYAAVQASTGFEPYRPRSIALSGSARRAAEDSREDYEALYERRVVL